MMAVCIFIAESQKIDQRNNKKEQYSWCGGQRKSREATTEQYLAHVTDE
jgi:hypothetical protein